MDNLWITLAEGGIIKFMIDETKIIKRLESRIDTYIKTNPGQKSSAAVETVREFIHMLQLEATEQAEGQVTAICRDAKCFLGDTVYLVNKNKTYLSEAIIYGFKYSKNTIMVNLLCNGEEIPVKLEDLNTIFFLEKEDAVKCIGGTE